MNGFRAALILSCALAGCDSPDEPRKVTTENRVAGERSVFPPQASPSTPPPLPEAPIDPKSAQAATQVVRRFFALTQAGQATEATRLWTDRTFAATFAGRFAGAQLHAEVGRPSDTEGAAGSIFVTVPVQLGGTGADGREFSSAATATLRRVNAVPGATPEQLRWRIASIES